MFKHIKTMNLALITLTILNCGVAQGKTFVNVRKDANKPVTVTINYRPLSDAALRTEADRISMQATKQQRSARQKLINDNHELEQSTGNRGQIAANALKIQQLEDEIAAWNKKNYESSIQALRQRLAQPVVLTINSQGGTQQDNPASELASIESFSVTNADGWTDTFVFGATSKPKNTSTTKYHLVPDSYNEASTFTIERKKSALGRYFAVKVNNQDLSDY